MSNKNLVCPSCGASISVGASATRAVCGRCGAALTPAPAASPAGAAAKKPAADPHKIIRICIAVTAALLVVVLVLIVIALTADSAKKKPTDKSEGEQISSVLTSDSETQPEKKWSAPSIEASDILSASDTHVAALTADRHVVVAGNIRQESVEDWHNIISVAAGQYFTVGLQNDNGKVVAAGKDKISRDVSSWSRITEIAAGQEHAVGLKDNGTVLVAGDISDDHREIIEDWHNIKAIAAGNGFTVGLTEDGLVKVACDDDSMYDSFDVENWSNIVAVSAGNNRIVGLSENGAVEFTTRKNDRSVFDVFEWENKAIIEISAGDSHMVGLCADGTVVAAEYCPGNDEAGQCDVDRFTNVAAIAAGSDYTIILTADGTVEAAGEKDNAAKNKPTDCTNWTETIMLPTQQSRLPENVTEPTPTTTVPSTTSLWGVRIRDSGGSNNNS